LSRGVLYVLAGPKHLDLLRQSIRILRCFDKEIPVVVNHDIDLDLETLASPANVSLVRFERRAFSHNVEKRNTNLRRFIALRDSPFEVTAYLDNDVFIVDEAFFDGFEIALHFGLTLPENPRAFILTRTGGMGDMEIGDDVSDYDREYLADMPRHMMAYNITLMFYHARSEWLVDEVIRQFESHPSRGQASLCRAVWRTRRTPNVLPVNWCVGQKHVGIEKPITLHVGQKKVYRWWQRDFEPWILEAERTGRPPHEIRRPNRARLLRRALRSLRTRS
jgi:hypothetical protein